MLLANREGIKITGPVVPLIAGGVAGALVVFTLPVLAGQLIGVKSAKILKVHLFNNGAGNTWVLLGTGVAGVGIPVLLPAMATMNNLEDIYDNLPEVESFANITAWAAVLVAPATIDIQLEILICG